jgi:glutamyl-tRNA synthetase
MSIVTRFAPSPTGFLHIGGARTALFNWLFTRHHGGTFRLRIEDTDKERSTLEATTAILQGLQWLGLRWDGEVVYQSARADRHRAVVETLLEKGLAYRCYATPEELDAMREEAKAAGRPVAYNRLWRGRAVTEAPAHTPYVVRLKMPLEGETVLEDLVQGSVRVQHQQLDDFILLRADGSSTYMLAVVVDDIDMGVTHIIRGDDHLNNAFRQLPLFQAIGARPPTFAHIPLIHGSDGAKLSKRHGALGVQEYEAMGILPDALCNYLLRLGWGKGDADLIHRDEAVRLFEMADVGKAPSRFDVDKLLSVNGHYVRALPVTEALSLLTPLLAARYPDAAPVQYGWLQQGLPALQERAKTLLELADMAGIYLKKPPLSRTEKAAAAFTPAAAALAASAVPIVEKITPFTHEPIFAALKTLASAEGVKVGAVAEALRILLTGDTASPSIADMMEIIGREETRRRIDQSKAE